MDNAIPSQIACNLEADQGQLKNWSGNITFEAQNVFYPKSLEEVQQIVRTCEKLRALGSKHSFSTIADSQSNQISLKYMNKVVLLDRESNTITVEAGARYGEFAAYLHEEGYALPNLASLPHITVVGACSTATHGSGLQNGNLSTSVSALEFINAAGDVVTLSKGKDKEQFFGAVVSLGAIGVITKITLDLLPAFEMKQLVYRNMPMSALKDNFIEIQDKGYSVSLFTNWKDQNINEVWIKSSTGKGTHSSMEPELFTAKLASENLHPIEDQSAENVTEQRGIPGAWYDRLPHFKMGFQPSVGKELQSEYFVAIEHAYEAMMAIEALHEMITPHLFISEIRTIHADNLWMSPCYQQTSVAFHFTWKQNIEAVMGLLPLVEKQLAPFKPKPHWGKLFTMPAAVLQSRYEKLGDFKKLVQLHDPTGKFRNEFLELLY
jgi:xylitol oxidase